MGAMTRTSAFVKLLLLLVKLVGRISSQNAFSYILQRPGLPPVSFNSALNYLPPPFFDNNHVLPGKSVDYGDGAVFGNSLANYDIGHYGYDQIGKHEGDEISDGGNNRRRFDSMTKGKRGVRYHRHNYIHEHKHKQEHVHKHGQDYRHQHSSFDEHKHPYSKYHEHEYKHIYHRGHKHHHHQDYKHKGGHNRDYRRVHEHQHGHSHSYHHHGHKNKR